MTEREESLRRVSQAQFAHLLVIPANPLTDSNFQAALSNVHCPSFSSTTAPLAVYLLGELTQLSRNEGEYREAANSLNCLSFEPVCQQYHDRLADATRIYQQRKAIVQQCYDQLTN